MADSPLHHHLLAMAGGLGGGGGSGGRFGPLLDGLRARGQDDTQEAALNDLAQVSGFDCCIFVLIVVCEDLKTWLGSHPPIDSANGERGIAGWIPPRSVCRTFGMSHILSYV